MNKHKHSWVNLESGGNQKREKPAEYLRTNGSISSVLNTVKTSFSNTDERWHLELLDLIIKLLATVIIVHSLTQSSVNNCVLRREGREEEREREWILLRNKVKRIMKMFNRKIGYA